MRLDSFKMRALGLLWCEGDATEKVIEFYDNCQDNNQPLISADDKDFKPNFYKMLDFATEICFDQETMITARPSAFSDEEVLEAKRKKYDELLEDFLDTVFGHESKLRREQWSEKVAQETSWIFNPS